MGKRHPMRATLTHFRTMNFEVYFATNDSTLMVLYICITIKSIIARVVYIFANSISIVQYSKAN